MCVCDFWRKLGGDFTSGGRKKIRAKERERESTIKSTMTVQVALCPLLDCNVTAGHSGLFYLIAATFLLLFGNTLTRSIFLASIDFYFTNLTKEMHLRKFENHEKVNLFHDLIPKLSS